MFFFGGGGGGGGESLKWLFDYMLFCLLNICLLFLSNSIVKMRNEEIEV